MLVFSFLSMNTSLKLSYGLEKNNAAAFATVAAKAGDVKFKASMTDATFVNGPSLTGLALAVEKPGSFVIDFDVPKKVCIPKTPNFRERNCWVIVTKARCGIRSSRFVVLHFFSLSFSVTKRWTRASCKRKKEKGKKTALSFYSLTMGLLWRRILSSGS